MDARGRAAAGLGMGQVQVSEVAVLLEPVGAGNFLSGSPNFISGSMGVASPLLCRRVAGVADWWSSSLIYNTIAMRGSGALLHVRGQSRGEQSSRAENRVQVFSGPRTGFRSRPAEAVTDGEWRIYQGAVG